MVDIIYVFNELSFNRESRTGMEAPGTYPISLDQFGRNILGHYGDVKYAMEYALKEGFLDVRTKVFCRVPPGLADFEQGNFNSLTIERRNLNELEREIVKSIMCDIPVIEGINYCNL